MGKTISTTTVYRVENISDEQGNDMPERVIQSFTRYDKNGNIVEEVHYEQDGTVSEEYMYDYNSDGKVVSLRLVGDEDEILEERKLDWAGGHIIQENIHYLDGSVTMVEYKYDDNDRLTEKLTLDEEGEQEAREEFTYEGDRLMVTEKYDEYDKMVYKLEEIYDGDNHSETMIWIHEDEYNHKTRVVRYNDKGYRSAELVYDAKDRLIERNTYETDDQGKLVQMKEENPVRITTTEFIYNDEGQVKEQIETDGDGNINNRVERYYDELGNQLETRVIIPLGSDEHRQYSMIYEYEYFD